ncbi:hypothetical protein ACFYS8_36335, partial [Kitasatospora sp. NPDC004615]|uniref:hypothetical protein n=1 Tax=Kitasatospora sp. NPDC004615 TaxID=3364017 RepID=UPI0036815981
YAARRTLWQITGNRSCRGCGRSVMDPDTGVIKAQTAEGHTVVLGTLKCANIWFCPPCSSSIRTRRAAEVTKAVVSWIRAGGSAYLVTFTPRHAYADRLDALMDAIQGTRASSADAIEAARAEVAAVKAELEQAKADARQAVDAAQAAAKADLLAARATARQAVQVAQAGAEKGQKKAAAAAARDGAEPLPGLKAVREAATEAARAEFEPLLADLEGWLAEARAAARGTSRQAGAYQRLITGGTWAGRPEDGDPDGLRGRIGYVGMIRATEVTLGQANGWHPHIHAIVLVGGRTKGKGADKVLATTPDGKWDTFEPDEDDLEEWEHTWRKVWTAALKQGDPRFEPSVTCEIPGCKCNGKGHGVDFKRLKTVQDAEKFGEYLAKTQDGKDPALELTGAANKDAWGENMTPFQMLGRIGDLQNGVPEDKAEGSGTLDWCLGRWWEYEAAVGGRRAIEWTRGLRKLLGIGGGDTAEDDADLLHEADGTSEFRAGVQVRTQAWHDVAAAGLDYEAVESVRGTDGIDLEAVEAVYEAAGAAPNSVRLLTGAEVDQTWQDVLAVLAERRQVAAARRAAENPTNGPTRIARGPEQADPPVPDAIAEALARPEPVNFLTVIRQRAAARRTPGAHPGAHRP